MKSPAISVCIPCYNGARTVGRCLDSVLAQKYAGPLEVVVVNDGSTDDTARILASYGDRIRAVRNERNSGLAKTLNRAVAESRGDIVLILACDCDLRTDSYLQRMVAHFDDPKMGAVVGKSLMDFERATSVQRIFTRLQCLDVNDPDTAVHDVNFLEVRCDGIRREVVDRIGILNEDLFHSNEDQDFSIRLVRAGYRLIQDNSLEYEMGFSVRQDTVRKLLTKQGEYARGQAFIAVNYGVGTNQGLWNNQNRRLRALHRGSQIVMGPLAVALSIAGAAFGLWWPLIALFGARSLYYIGLAYGLRPLERLAAVPLGLACDAIYSTAFLSGAAMWIARGKSMFGSGHTVRERA